MDALRQAVEWREFPDDSYEPKGPRLPLRALTRTLLSNYAAFLPGIAALLLCLCLRTHAQCVLLTVLFSPLLLAAAARSLGYINSADQWAGVQRCPSHLLNLFILSIPLGLAASPGLLFTVILSSEHADLPDVVPVLALLVVSGIPALVLLFRLWPAATVSFTCYPTECHSAWRRGWQGPGLRAAWRLTGIPGAFFDFTWPLFKHSLLVLGGFGGADLLFSRWTPFAIVLGAIFYFLLVPFCMLYLVDVGGRLHAKWREEEAMIRTSGRSYNDQEVSWRDDELTPQARESDSTLFTS